MELTKQQQKTLKHLKQYLGIVEPMDIIKYCVEQLGRPQKSNKSDGPKRGHTVTFYQGIINYLAQQKHDN